MGENAGWELPEEGSPEEERLAEMFGSLLGADGHEVLRELRVRIDGRERVVRVRRRIAPTGPRCPEWWHGWCQHPLGHAGPHKWGDR